MKLVLISCFVILFLIQAVSAADCGGNITCDCGDTLTSDHIMTYDLLDCPDASGLNGINIGANGITLDCAGHRVSGYGGGSGGGIQVEGVNNVTVENCHVVNFDWGFYLDYSSAGRFVNNESVQDIV